MPKGHVRWVKPPPRRTAPPPPPPTFTCDQIEGHDWFARLPKSAQDEIVGLAKSKETRAGERTEFVRRSMKRAMAKGAALFLFIETFCASGPSVVHSVAAVLAGLGVGVLWHRIGAGRFRCALIAALPFVLLRALFPGETPGWTAGMAVLGFVMLVPLAALIGFDREIRRADDLDY